MAGGAFGGKNANVYLLLAPMAAELNGRPVKLVLARADVFTMMPFRVVGPAAIGDAIFHAAGVRLTSLPFRIDRLLAGMNAER